MGTDKSVYKDEYFLSINAKRKIVEELINDPYVDHTFNLSLADINGEYWEDIKLDGLFGLFKISNLERVKALSRHVTKSNGRVVYLKEKIRKPIVDKETGYKKMSFKNKSKGVDIDVSIHILMALHFVHNPNPKKYKQVNHLTGNKLDNRPKNLEWVTRRQDLIHKYHILNNSGFGDRKGKHSLCSKIIIQKSLSGNIIREWDSQGDIERSLGFNQSDISRACTKHSSSHGFLWGFKNNL